MSLIYFGPPFSGPAFSVNPLVGDLLRSAEADGLSAPESHWPLSIRLKLTYSADNGNVLSKNNRLHSIRLCCAAPC